jgi:hypothetical protein
MVILDKIKDVSITAEEKILVTTENKDDVNNDLYATLDINRENANTIIERLDIQMRQELIKQNNNSNEIENLRSIIEKSSKRMRITLIALFNFLWTFATGVVVIGAIPTFLPTLMIIYTFIGEIGTCATLWLHANAQRKLNKANADIKTKNIDSNTITNELIKLNSMKSILGVDVIPAIDYENNRVTAFEQPTQEEVLGGRVRKI